MVVSGGMAVSVCVCVGGGVMVDWHDLPFSPAKNYRPVTLISTSTWTLTTFTCQGHTPHTSVPLCSL